MHPENPIPNPSSRAVAGRRRPRGVAWLLVALLALPVLSASAGGRHPGGHGMRGLEQRLEKLDLDAQVREQVDGILDAARDDARELHRETRAAHERLRSLLEQDEPDAEAVLAQADVVGALRTRAHKQKLGLLLQIRPLLSEEQREQLREQRPRHGRHGDRSLR